MRGLYVAAIVLIASCGIPQEEHDAALAAEKARYDEEMAKQRKASEGVVARKDNQISELETEVKTLGGDLQGVRDRVSKLDEQLGERSIQLASTKASLEDTKASLQDTTEKLQATSEELEEVRALRERAEAAAAAFQELAQKLKSMVDSGQLQVRTRKGRMVLELPDDILFAAGRKRLKGPGKAALEAVAKVLKDVADRDFLIAGHTDNVPLKRGARFKSNWDLSTARAVEVVKLMIAGGVAPERLAAAGYGEFDPVGDNETKEGRAKNRRLEIILMPKLSELPGMQQ